MPEQEINPEFAPWVMGVSKVVFEEFLNSVTDDTFKIFIFWSPDEDDNTINLTFARNDRPDPEGRFLWKFGIKKDKAIEALANCNVICTFVFKLLDEGYMLILAGEQDEATLIKGSKVSVQPDSDIFMDRDKGFKISLVDKNSPKGDKIALIQ